MHAGIESSKPETKACRLDIGTPLSFLSLGIHLRSSTREKGIKADDCTGVCAVSQLHMLLQALSWHHGTHGTVCVLLLCPRPPPCGWDFPRTGVCGADPRSPCVLAQNPVTVSRRMDRWGMSRFRERTILEEMAQDIGRDAQKRRWEGWWGTLVASADRLECPSALHNIQDLDTRHVRGKERNICIKVRKWEKHTFLKSTRKTVLFEPTFQVFVLFRFATHLVDLGCLLSLAVTSDAISSPCDQKTDPGNSHIWILLSPVLHFGDSGALGCRYWFQQMLTNT